MSFKRISVIAGMVSASLLVLAPAANASWEGKLTKVHVNYESLRWSDELYTQITWYDCESDIDASGSYSSFSAQIWEDISWEPDESYDKKTFTACFLNQRSNGEWTDLPAGKKQYYFQIMDINGSKLENHWLTVGRYIQDTTKAD